VAHTCNSTSVSSAGARSRSSIRTTTPWSTRTSTCGRRGSIASNRGSCPSGVPRRLADLRSKAHHNMPDLSSQSRRRDVRVERPGPVASYRRYIKAQAGMNSRRAGARSNANPAPEPIPLQAKTFLTPVVPKQEAAVLLSMQFRSLRQSRRRTHTSRPWRCHEQFWKGQTTSCVSRPIPP